MWQIRKLLIFTMVHVCINVSKENFITSKDFKKHPKKYIKVIFLPLKTVLFFASIADSNESLAYSECFIINYYISIPWIWMNPRRILAFWEIKKPRSQNLMKTPQDFEKKAKLWRHWCVLIYIYICLYATN